MRNCQGGSETPSANHGDIPLQFQVLESSKKPCRLGALSHLPKTSDPNLYFPHEHHCFWCSVGLGEKLPSRSDAAVHACAIYSWPASPKHRRLRSAVPCPPQSLKGRRSYLKHETASYSAIFSRVSCIPGPGEPKKMASTGASYAPSTCPFMII